jgi:hypothetical protein
VASLYLNRTKFTSKYNYSQNLFSVAKDWFELIVAGTEHAISPKIKRMAYENCRAFRQYANTPSARKSDRLFARFVLPLGYHISAAVLKLLHK